MLRLLAKVRSVIEHGLGQVELVVARPQGLWEWADGWESPADDELAIANDDEEEDAIAAGHGAFASPAERCTKQPEACTNSGKTESSIIHRHRPRLRWRCLYWVWRRIKANLKAEALQALSEDRWVRAQ